MNSIRSFAKRGMELFAHALAVALSGLLAFYAGKLAWQSRVFNDMSTGNDATPLWIPQLGMAVGTLILFIAFADEFVIELRGRRPARDSTEMARSE